MKTPCHRRLFTRIAREPFVHFLVLGALIFAAYAQLNPDTAERRIVVRAADVGRLREVAIQQWGKVPDARQMDELVQAFVREEVLYRAALDKGLDRDDVIVRRRLAQKMEFLANEEVRAPNDQELRRYLAAHPAQFLQPASADFEQVYFNPDSRGKSAVADAEQALAALRAGKTVHADNFMLAGKRMAQEHSVIVRDFGDGFADAVFSQPVGEWLGPIRSAYGLHLLRVVARQPEAPGRFEAVRDRVAAEMVNARVAAAREAAYAKLLGRYTVVLPSAYAAFSAPSGEAEKP